MKTHTSSFKEQIKLMGKEIDSRITFGDTVLGKDDLNAVTPSYQGAILKSVMKQLDIDSNVAIPIGTILKYEFGLKVNGEYEYINYGNYVVYSIEKQEDTNSYKITCYDKLLYSMLDYVKLPITYPISIRDYINSLSTALGLKFANKSGTFANYNKQIQADLYDGLGYTFRDVLDELAQVTASTICLNNNDELEIRYITETGDTIDEEFLKDVNVNFGEKFGKVNTIVLSRSAGSDNIYYPETLPANPYEIKISDNQIMNGNDRADFLPDIYNKLNGLEFYTNDFVSTGIIYYDLCDRYSVKVGDNTYSCVMFNDEVLVTQGLEENIYTELPEQTKTDYKKADTTDRRINQAYAILDKQNKEFEVLVSEVNSNEEKIGSLEITTGNISTKVSSVEKNLSTTNTNLSNLSNTVDTLSNDINGVSADFEDFKDNEYIQSIDNLQKQIDGAIQFWNGAEIPTINNYPANLWTTENDKINHQADIYTVVQDVEGEMKQGKSYRFDKIDGVWQWIELTDNELSAVQAIAQEALDKAKSNATEIGTVKTRVSSLEQTDEQIKASVESIDKQIIPTANISGSNIYVEDASDNPLVKLEIEGKSEQETRSGYNLIGLSNGTNTLNEITYTINDNGKIILNGTSTAITKIYFPLLKSFNSVISESYTLQSFNPISYNGVEGDLRIRFTDNALNEYGLLNITTSNSSITTILDTKSVINITNLMIRIDNGVTLNNFEIKPQAFLGQDTNKPYEKYGVSPSPDFPSEIESVGYENLFDGYLESGGIYTDSGLDYANTNRLRTRFIDVKPNKKYCLSLEGVTKPINIITYNSSKSFIKTITINTGTPIETPSDCYYIRFYSELDLADYNIQLEKGSIAHPYIPYGKYGVVVKTVGKNIFKPTLIADDGNIIQIANGTVALNDDVYSLTATGTDLYFGEVTNKGEIYTGTKGNLIDVSNYDSISFALSNNLFTKNLFTCYDENLISLGYYQQRSSKNTIQASSFPTGTKYITFRFGVNPATVGETYETTVLITPSSDVEYEPYQENKILFVLNDPLRSLPNEVKDIAYIKNNKLYVDRKVGSRLLNGTENWSNPVSQGFYCTTSDFNIANKSVLICDKYTNYTSSDFTKQDYAIGMLYNNAQQLYLRNINITTRQELLKWLSENNTQVDYELAEPYTEDLGEINMPRTFKGVNHISTTDELEPTLNIEYVRDTTLSNYVEGQINKVMTIEERHYSELVIEDDNIKASVESVNSSLNGLNTTINRVEEITTDNSQVINVISTNIDKTSGEIREVTTTTGFTFNANGMTIDDGSGFKAQHRSGGTYYKDGESIVGQYTKDGSKQKDLELFGTYSYGKESINDTPMFVGQLYTDENGEQGFGHFYNGEG